MRKLSYYFIASGNLLVVIAAIVKLTQNPNSTSIFISGLLIAALGAVLWFKSKGATSKS